jgi:hypothetical protein
MQVSAGVEAEDGASEEENVEDELHWERLGGEIIRLTLQPNDYGFGISLAGTNRYNVVLLCRKKLNISFFLFF